MKYLPVITASVGLVVAAGAFAQGLQPASPEAPAPALRYDSAFSGYRPSTEKEAGGWREANDLLAPKPRAATPPSAPSPMKDGKPGPAPGAHRGHHGGGMR